LTEAAFPFLIEVAINLRIDKEVILGRIKKCKLSWKPSESNLNVDYKLYWSNATPVSYDSNCIKLGSTTEVYLPDILVTHESLGESIYLGISAVDEWGNESDIITLPEPYKLSAPAAPMDLSLTALNDFKFTVPREKAENQDSGKYKQAAYHKEQDFQSKDRRPAIKSITTEGKIVDAIKRSLDNELLS